MTKRKSKKTPQVEQSELPKEPANSLMPVDEQLLLAASRGNLDAVNEALDKGANVNARGQYGVSALHEAAGAGHLAIVKRLVAAGANIESQGGSDMTPLMNATFAGHIEVVQFLLDQGAQVTHDLLSSLQMKVNILFENAEAGMVNPQAAESWNQFLKWMQLAQIKQIKPQMQHHSAAEAQLLRSAGEGDVDQLKMAIQAGANVNVSDDQDIAALRWAARSGHSEAVTALLDAGADINQKSNSGWTALMQAVIAGKVAMVSLLIERGAETQAKTFAEASALDFARDIVSFSPDQEAAKQIIQLLEAHS